MQIRGDLVQSTSLGELQLLYDYLLVVDDKGFLTYVGEANSIDAKALLENSEEKPQSIPSGSFLLPPFCDLHLHAPQFLYQGTGLHLPLMEWLNEYAFKAEEKMDSDPQLAEKVYTRLAERLIENGTGAVLLFGTIKESTNLILAECMRKAGIRAFVGKLSMDRSSRPTYVESGADAALAAAASFVDNCNAIEQHLPPHEKLIEPVLTPRFVPTCSDALLSGLGKLSEERSLRVQSHMAEAHDQVEWVRQERGMEDMDVFDKHGLLTPRTVQAHCTFLDPSSLQHVTQRGTAIAHCPLSNAYFSTEPFHLREALQNKVRVGLGTDIAGGYDIGIMSAMRHAVTISRMREGRSLMDLSLAKASGIQSRGNLANLSINWKEALFLGTRGGAEALGLKSGAFIVGSPFDAQQIQIIDPDTGDGCGPIDFLDNEGNDIRKGITKLSLEAVEKWFCLGDVRNRVGMWIQGRQVPRTM